SGLIGTFVDYDNSGVSSNFRALVSWGDGTASFATVTETGVDALNHPNFQITGAHVYATAATTVIRVDISDIIGRTTTYQTEGSPAVEITYFFDATTQTYKTIMFLYG